jgi:hypothetical protein
MKLMNFRSQEILSSEEFLEFVELELGTPNEDTIPLAAKRLQGLANNRNMLLDRVNQGLAKLADQTVLSASAATLFLGRCRTKPWFIRANLWPAIGPSGHAVEKAVFSYEGVHDHNFSFLTANCLGPGYETDVWINRSAKEDGHDLGESVQLDFQGRFTLSPFTQMYYEHGRDVHLQLPPSELTVSINLMFNDPAVRSRPQHGFDTVNSRVIDRPSGTMSMRRAQLIGMAARVGDANTLDILDWLASASPCKVTRTASKSARLALLTRVGL